MKNPHISEGIDESESSEVSQILSQIDKQKSDIISGIGNVGYIQSIDIWEQMREQCFSALQSTINPSERQKIQEKIRELEEVETTAFTEKIVETLTEAQSWKECQETYETLLQKLSYSTLDQSKKQDLLSNLQNNLEITNNHLREKKFIAEHNQPEQKILTSSSYAQSIQEWGELIQKYSAELQQTNIPKYQALFQDKLQDLNSNKFIAEQETEENKIITKTSYKKSIPKWESLINKYESQIIKTGKAEYIQRFQKKITALKGKKFLAESYAEIKETKDEKKGKNWKESKEIYQRIFTDTQSNSHLSAAEKKELKSEALEALAIAKANDHLKESHADLLDAEEKIQKLGYRKSIPYWKKLALHYRFLKREASEGPGTEKREEDFAAKEKEMQQNFLVSYYYGKLENQKESRDSWEKSYDEYHDIYNSVDNSNIPNSQKQGILQRAEEYKDIAADNKEIKGGISDAQDMMSNAVENLDWEESKTEHFEVHTYLQGVRNSVHEEALESSRMRELDSVMDTISKNIKTCTIEINAEKQKNSVFNQETVEELSAENPQFKYLYRIFLATQYQKSDPKILEYEKKALEAAQHIPESVQYFDPHSSPFSGLNTSAENQIGRMQYAPTENTELNQNLDTQVSAEQIKQQQVKEMQENNNNPEQLQTLSIDISASGVAAADLNTANTNLENAVQHSEKINLYDSEIGIQLNSTSSQEESFAKAMKSTLPPEMSQNITTQNIASFLAQKSTDQVLKTQVID